MTPHVPTPRLPPEHVFAALVGTLLALVAVLAGALLQPLWWLSEEAVEAAEAEAACVRHLAPTTATELENVRRHCRAQYPPRR